MMTLLAWRAFDITLGVLFALVMAFAIRLALREGFTRNRGGIRHYRSTNPIIFFCDLALIAFGGVFVGGGMIALAFSADPVLHRKQTPHVPTVQETSPGYLYFK